jgi:hypothetical protein
MDPRIRIHPKMSWIGNTVKKYAYLFYNEKRFVRSELGQGKLYRLEGVVAHHFCLLFATPLLQVIHIN